METGTLRFGGDWTGVFLRGDDAFGLALNLREVLRSVRDGAMPSELDLIRLDGLLWLLEASDERKADHPLTRQIARDAEDCITESLSSSRP